MEPRWHAVDVDPASAAFPVVAKVAEERVVIHKTAKGFRASELRCPHLQHAMTAAIQMSNGTMLRCPKHNFIFRLTDGKGVNCVGLRLKVYEVRESEGRLEVALESGTEP
jgi:nitrite reductase/ring-hydroxylating ferredoxin subunit